MNITVTVISGLNVEASVGGSPQYSTSLSTQEVSVTQSNLEVIVSDIPFVQTGASTGSSVDTGWIDSTYYPRSNPSGFASGIDASSLYPRTNPSGYINSGFVTGYTYSGYVSTGQTGSFVSIYNTGSFVTTGQTGSFGGGSTPTGKLLDTGQAALIYYPISNPSGFITSAESSGVLNINGLMGAVDILSNDLSISTGITSLTLDYFKSNATILRDGADTITGVNYANGRSVRIYRNIDEQITGVSYGYYQKRILRDSSNITGIEFL